LAVESPQWYALWTQSHCEQLVCDQLTAKGFEVFLPTIREWSRRAGVRRLIQVPMFSSYLFVHHAIEKRSYVEIVSTRGLVRILGERWDQLEAIDEAEIHAIQRLERSDLPWQRYPYLREGQRVRIVEGALTGVDGILVRTKTSRGLLVLSVNLLNRSVAVEVDCAAVVPIGSSCTSGFTSASVMAGSACL
jgi:transcription antitermination factor NusG